MGFERAITVDITGELAEHVAQTVGEHGFYESATEYVRDLIRRDIKVEADRFDAFRAELQAAFAEPEENYVDVTAEEVIARNGLRG